MEDIFLSTRIDLNRSICISPLPAETYRDSGGKGLGGEYGYFIYEIDETQPHAGVEIIGKAASIDAALRIFEIMSGAVAAKAA